MNLHEAIARTEAQLDLTDAAVTLRRLELAGVEVLTDEWWDALLRLRTAADRVIDGGRS